jgi:3-deoxy-D-manno-octulosonate 8-phosphate phosphatase (KDO 8-P phosphatase)
MVTALEPQELARRANGLEWLLCDVDGVLTDGRVYFGAEGESLKCFDIRDGLGLKLAQRAGLSVGVLSARRSAPLEQRVAELGLDEAVLGAGDKAAAFATFLGRHGLEADRVAYVGDDLIDLRVMVRCGLSFAPADAATEVREAADIVVSRGGGRGAVREIVELLLRARGEWAAIVAGYSD